MRPKHLLLMLSMVLTFSAVAQKNKTVEFTPAGLPNELLEYMNKTTSDSDRQKENTKILKAFKPVYTALDAPMQQRLVDVYAYAVKAKLKGNPELSGLTEALAAYASAPGGGANFEVFVQGLEGFKKRNAKGKAVVEYAAFCQGLLADRTLYKSNSAEWRFDGKAPFTLELKNGTLLARFDTPSDLNYFSNNYELFLQQLEEMKTTLSEIN